MPRPRRDGTPARSQPNKRKLTDAFVDHIQIDPTLFADFAAVKAHAANDGHGNTVITYDTNDTITLTGVAPSQLHVNDFFFV